MYKRCELRAPQLGPAGAGRRELAAAAPLARLPRPPRPPHSARPRSERRITPLFEAPPRCPTPKTAANAVTAEVEELRAWIAKEQLRLVGERRQRPIEMQRVQDSRAKQDGAPSTSPHHRAPLALSCRSASPLDDEHDRGTLSPLSDTSAADTDTARGSPARVAPSAAPSGAKPQKGRPSLRQAVRLAHGAALVAAGPPVALDSAAFASQLDALIARALRAPQCSLERGVANKLARLFAALHPPECATECVFTEIPAELQVAMVRRLSERTRRTVSVESRRGANLRPQPGRRAFTVATGAHARLAHVQSTTAK